MPRHENYVHDRALALFRTGRMSLDEAITAAATELAELERRQFNDADERPRVPLRRMVGAERNSP